MLDTDLIVNVIVGILLYKGIIAILEISCIKILTLMLGKKLQSTTRQDRINEAIKLAEEELKRTELN